MSQGTSSESKNDLNGSGTETPPRHANFAELGTPISGTTLTTLDPDNGEPIWKLPPYLPNTTTSRKSRAEYSMTSSVYSVTSGMVTQGGAVTEDLEGLVVQTTPSEEEAKRSSPPSMPALMADLKQHLDKTLVELRDQSRRDFEKVLSVLQAESAKRTALEGRLHSQLLLQSETMVAMELKLLRLEAKVERREAAQRQSQRNRPPRIDEEYDRNRLPPPPRNDTTGPTNIAVISSGASLASGVTAEDFRELEESGEDNKSDEENADGDVEDSEGDHGHGHDALSLGDSDSTPTQSSRYPSFGGTLESILLNPMLGEVSEHGTSTRATRGDADGNSSLATSVTNVTNSTLTSTVVTATTRGDSVRGRQADFDDAVGTPAARGRRSSGEPEPRSRSQSPLTVQSSVAEQTPSMASGSVGMSILSTAAVAPARSFGSRRAYAAQAATMNGDSRPLANRVVSFENHILQNPPAAYVSEAGDSITMPDELDNLSEVADSFASSARLWREEYEARLDALQKRWSE